MPMPTTKTCLTLAAVLGALWLVPSAVSAQVWSEPGRPPPPPRGEGPRGAELNETAIPSQGTHELIGEVWVDNWFALSVDGRALIEDSVPITTERSFNAERFTFRATPPVVLAFTFRDFMQNETGLEYIGSHRQQMGDGGAIVQFRDAASGRTVLVSNASWRCLVVQRAPLDAACARESDPQVDRAPCTRAVVPYPSGWTLPGFDDSGWPAATEHSASAVGPKDGYRRIDWDPAARFVWGPDLKRDNVVLCRATLSE